MYNIELIRRPPAQEIAPNNLQSPYNKRHYQSHAHTRNLPYAPSTKKHSELGKEGIQSC